MHSQTYCFDRAVAYEEIPAQHRFIEAYFQFHNPCGHAIRVIPDGALDLTFLYGHGQPAVYVGGTALHGHERSVPIDDRAFGVRLRPGIVLDCFRGSMGDMLDASLCLNDEPLFKALLEKIIAQPGLHRKAALFQEAFTPWATARLHPLTQQLLQRLDHPGRRSVLEDLVQETGYSHTHANRVFKSETGLSLKFYFDTRRIQRAIYLMERQPIRHFQDFAADLGFYDQPHFTKVFKNYTGYTPKKFYKMFNITLK